MDERESTTEVAPPVAGETPVVTQSAELTANAAVKDVKDKLASEDVVVSAPFSYHGSAARIWKLTKASDETAYKIALTICAVLGVILAWILVTCWYVIFGLLLVPYRLIRRSQRKRKMENARHRELLQGVEGRK